MPATLLHDMLDDSAPIDVVADISFLTTADGGKTLSVRERYLPNHNFGAPSDNVTYIGLVQFDLGDEVAPGESRRVRVRFLGAPGLDELLTVGREWRIQEAPSSSRVPKSLSDVQALDRGAFDGGRPEAGVRASPLSTKLFANERLQGPES